jgi:predicted nucleotidyltransferase
LLARNVRKTSVDKTTLRSGVSGSGGRLSRRSHLTMRQHHAESIDALKEHFRQRRGTLAIILHGSLARGEERPDSDINVVVVLDNEEYETCQRQRRLAELTFDLATYEGGVVVVKYVTRDFLVEAERNGSEPTRYSFLGARVVYACEPEIGALVRRISRYPLRQKQEKILTFYSGMSFWLTHFWSEAGLAGDGFLATKAATEGVYCGMRLLLAHNEVLFAGHKRLLQTVRELREKPDNIAELGEALVLQRTDELRDRFLHAIETFRDWNLPPGSPSLFSRFVEDSEQWWWNDRPYVSEW